MTSRCQDADWQHSRLPIRRKPWTGVMQLSRTTLIGGLNETNAAWRPTAQTMAGPKRLRRRRIRRKELAKNIMPHTTTMGDRFACIARIRYSEMLVLCMEYARALSVPVTKIAQFSFSIHDVNVRNRQKRPTLFVVILLSPCITTVFGK